MGSSFDVWLRSVVLLAYLDANKGHTMVANEVVGEVDELVEYVKTGCMQKELSPTGD